MIVKICQKIDGNDDFIKVIDNVDSYAFDLTNGIKNFTASNKEGPVITIDYQPGISTSIYVMSSETGHTLDSYRL